MAVTADACFPLGTEKHVFVDWNIVEPGYGVAWAVKVARSVGDAERNRARGAQAARR